MCYMENELISVIIPVYNVELYLSDCLNSVLAQTYKNMEIILIDDGSTDNSGNLCDCFKKNDKRIKVVHKRNGGLSDARNVGLENANGKYVCFIDSDDIVKNDYISSMKKYISKTVKISSCGYCRYINGQKIKINYDKINKYYEGIEAQKYLNIIGYFNVSVCNKLFDMELFDNIRFPYGKKSEDWFVMYRLIEEAGGIYYNSDIKYYYRQRIGSITKSSSVNEDAIEAAKTVYEYYIKKSWRDAVPYAAQSLAFANIGVYNAYLCMNGKKDKMTQIHRNVVCLMKDITYKKISVSRKIQLFLFVKCLYVYNIVFKMYDLKRKSG